MKRSLSRDSFECVEDDELVSFDQQKFLPCQMSVQNWLGHDSFECVERDKVVSFGLQKFLPC